MKIRPADGVALALLFVLALVECWPMLSHADTFGFHDWDVAAAHRQITVLSVGRYHEGPWWHPYLCGGFPAFGHPEGAPNLISPFLPIYLLFDLRVAIRAEVFGAALIALGGGYALAARFTRVAALRALCALTFALSSRFSLQAAVGHAWHLAYAYLPWALFFFDRALEPGRYKQAFATGALLALMAYAAGIYPLPHTALVLALYALALSLLRRNWRPLAVLSVAALSGIGLALPKLMAVRDAMSRAPRLIESNEVIGWKQLGAMLLSRAQEYGKGPISMPKYNWHEWGIYVGPLGVLLCAAAVLARGARERALAIVGCVLLLLGFGAFHPLSPWALLHRLPLFSSQHVPSRFFYPMLLVLGLAGAAALGRFVDARVGRDQRLEYALLAVVALFGFDIASVASRPFEQSFTLRAPDTLAFNPRFEHRIDAPAAYSPPDWAAPVLLGMFDNVGVIRCYGLDPSFREIGALAANAPGYRGLAWVDAGEGSAEVVEWSPNHARVRVNGAAPGARVIYDMNWDPSWRSGSEAAENVANLVSGRLREGESEIEFHYLPRVFRWSVWSALATLLLIFLAPPEKKRQGGGGGGGAGGTSGGALDGVGAGGAGATGGGTGATRGGAG